MKNSVFLSSTFEELKTYRKAVIDFLQSRRCNYEAMENFSASPNPPKEECLKKVEDSDVFIIILGRSYGSVDPKAGISYTQLEYEKAFDSHLKVLAFLMAEENAASSHADNIDQGEDAKMLKNLKETIRGRCIVSYFTTADDLVEKVSDALEEYAPEVLPGGWHSYKGIFRIGKYLSAYIPILNPPLKKHFVTDFSCSDINVHADTAPYVLPAEFSVNDTFGCDDGECCRLSGCNLEKINENQVEIDISKTSYLDYIRSGECLDSPSKNDPEMTYRQIFDYKFGQGSLDFTSFNLTNICGCGMFILTEDDNIAVARHSPNARVYPDRLTYAASGVMKYGNHPDPFMEIAFKAREELNHQVNINKLRMIGFGADARKLYFQFGFFERIDKTFDELAKEHDGFLAIKFRLESVIHALIHGIGDIPGIWEPAAEAALLTLLIQKYSFQEVSDELEKHKNFLIKHDMMDEWDYRAACGGEAATLSVRYDKDRITEIARQYVSDVLKFIGSDVKRKNVLEIGSGDGLITKGLIHSGASMVTCVDMCERLIEKSKETLKSYKKKITYENMFAQDYNREGTKTHDVAVISRVLIHNVDEPYFSDLVQNVCRQANTIFVFEDISDRATSPYTRLRPEESIIEEFSKNGFVVQDRKKDIEHHWLGKDTIAFIKFSRSKTQ